MPAQNQELKKNYISILSDRPEEQRAVLELPIRGSHAANPIPPDVECIPDDSIMEERRILSDEPGPSRKHPFSGLPQQRDRRGGLWRLRLCHSRV